MTGAGVCELAGEFAAMPGVDNVAPFGASLHVSGRDAPALEAAIARLRDDRRFTCTRSMPSSKMHSSNSWPARKARLQ